MIKICTLFIFSIISFTNSYSQSISPEWTARYNSNESAFDFATNMAVDSAGNVYVTGKSWGDGTDYDYSTIKYNSSGVFLWAARYNGPGNYIDEPTGIAVDKNGNVFVTGFSYGGSSDYDYATIKYNSNGVQQWVDRYNGSADSTDKSNSIALDGSGNIFITGQSTKLYGSSNDFDCATIKYNSSGIRVWTRSYELQEGSDDFGNCIKLDYLGNVYIVGSVYSDLLKLKYSNNGVFQWAFIEYGLIGPYLSNLDNLGNLFITSHKFNVGDSCLIKKYNSSGIRLWTSSIFDFTPKSIVVDSSGNPYLTGVRGFYGGNDIITIKYNSSGNQLWYERFSGPNNIVDEAISLSLDISGNIYVSGYSSYPSTGADFVIIKYNSSGIYQWMSRYNGLLNETDLPTAIGIDYSGNVYVTGYTIALYTEYDYLTLKYSNSLQLNANILLEGFYNSSINKLSKKDTITAYLRNTSYPYSLVDSGKAIIDTITFRCGFCFNHATSGSYYITLKHRNSLETWSKLGGEFFPKSKPLYYDFTSNNSTVYGSNLALIGSKYCLYSGDVNQDGFITLFDVIPIYNNASNFITGNYLSTDLTGDNIVDLTDVTICYNNSSNFIRARRP